jgi:hypothetical protein
MKKFRTLSFLAILVSVSAICTGQKGFKPGYIITTNFDTISGMIKVKSNYLNSKSCDFIDNGHTDSRTLYPGDIRAYRIENSKFYVSKEIVTDAVKQKVFLEYLVEGIVDLYYLKKLSNECFFIRKDTMMVELNNDASVLTEEKQYTWSKAETKYAVNSNQYKRILTYLFQESASVEKKIPNVPFDYNPLVKITTEYHNSVCKDRKCIDYTRTARTGIYLEPYFGFINSWMGLRTSKTHPSDFQPYGGFYIRFKPSKGRSVVNLLTGASISSDTYQGDFPNTLKGYGELTYRLSTSYSVLRIPFKVAFTAPNGKLKPYGTLGYTNILLFNAEYNALELDHNYPVETPFRKYMAGFTAGCGIKYEFNNSYLILNNEFEYRRTLVKNNFVFDNHYVYSNMLSLGFGFRLK